MNETIQGFIIRSVPYKESDAIITLASIQGLIVFKARGIFKITSKNASACQLYAHGEYTLDFKAENANKVLISAKLLNYPFFAFSDFGLNSLLAFICEAILKCEESSKYEGYYLLEYITNHLSDNLDLITISLIIFKYILKWNGILLEVNQCVDCGSMKNIVGISFLNGGFLCGDCSKENKIEYLAREQLQQIRYMIKANINNLNDFAVDSVFGYELLIKLFDFIENASGITFKSKEVLLFSLRK